MRKWRKWRQLSREERRTLALAMVLLLLARFTSRFVALRATPDAPDASPSDIERARAFARLVGIASGHCPVRATCLHRSIVLWRLLRARGIPCALHLGVRAAGAFQAHAWVECGGVALEDGLASRASYLPFATAVVPLR
jgi:hypothetical protein